MEFVYLSRMPAVVDEAGELMGTRLNLLEIEFLKGKKRKIPCGENTPGSLEKELSSRADLSGRWLLLPSVRSQGSYFLNGMPIT